MRYFYLAVALALAFSAYCVYETVSDAKSKITNRLQLIEQSTK